MITILRKLNRKIASQHAERLQTTFSRNTYSQINYHCNELTGTELHQPRPESIQLDPELKRLALINRPFLHDSMYSVEVRNATIPTTNPVAFDSQGQVVIESLLQSPLQYEEAFRFYSPIGIARQKWHSRRMPKIHISEAFLLASQFSQNYYHFLFDTLIKIHALDELRRQNACESPVILVPRELPAFANQYLDLLQVSPIAYLSGNIHVERLHVPCSARSLDFHRPSSVKFLRDRLVEFGGLPESFPQALGNAKLKIFVARSDSEYRPHRDENLLTKIVEDLGFQIVKFATMPLREQMLLMSKASVVCGMHGAGLSNMLFMKQVNLIELFDETCCDRGFFLNLASIIAENYRGILLPAAGIANREVAIAKRLRDALSTMRIV